MKNNRWRMTDLQPATSGIYAIHCLPNQYSYIGSSTFVLFRWLRHIKNITSGKAPQTSMLAIIEDYHRYGADNFVFEMLFECAKDRLVECEQAEIRKRIRQGAKLYNIVPANVFPKSRRGNPRIPPGWEKLPHGFYRYNAKLEQLHEQ